MDLEERRPTNRELRLTLQKRRLDELCAELYPEHDLKTIQSWILQGKVTVKGRVTTGAGTAVPLSAAVSLNVLAERYVAR